MHWWASRSSGYCSADNTETPCLSCAARSCLGLSGSVDLLGTSFSTISNRLGIPDVSFEHAHSPTVSSCARRRRLTNVERHEFVCKSPVASWDGGCGTIPGQLEVESPSDQTRRRKWWDHWQLVGSQSVELLFFRLKLGIVALFPGFCAAKLDLLFMQKRPKRFNANSGNHLFLKKILSQLLQRPSLKWTAQEVRRTLCRLDNKSLVIFSKLSGPSRPRFRLQRLEFLLIELFDNGPHMMLRVMNQLGDTRHFKSLIRRQDHLGTSEFNTAGAAPKNSLNLLTLANTEIAGIQTHKKSLSMHSDTKSFLRACLYNTLLCIAQVFNVKYVNIIYLKRH
jgi:hypothetical protein